MAQTPPSSHIDDAEGEEETASHERPKSQRSQTSLRSKRSRISNNSHESTPLLSGQTDNRSYGDAPAEAGTSTPATSSLRSLQDGEQGKGKSQQRWPTYAALSFLTLTIIAILALGFAAPAVVQEYAMEAMVFKPTDLSIDSFTASGVKARIQGDFMLDASKVHKKAVRDLGRAGTRIAKAVESKTTKVEVRLPEYDDMVLGTAIVPSIVVDVRNGHITHIDFLTDLEPGDVAGLRRIANDWIEGRLGELRVQGTAKVALKSGLFSFGTQRISEILTFKGSPFNSSEF